MSHDIIKDLVSDSFKIDNTIFSVNSGSRICEVKCEKDLPVREGDKYNWK